MSDTGILPLVPGPVAAVTALRAGGTPALFDELAAQFSDTDPGTTAASLAVFAGLLLAELEKRGVDGGALLRHWGRTAALYGGDE